jgi:hypothetical protein
LPLSMGTPMHDLQFLRPNRETLRFVALGGQLPDDSPFALF